MSGSLGLIPFYNVKDIPMEKKWSRVNEDDLETVTQGIEVYDLIWTEKIYEGFLLSNKLRFFVNPETNLPQRVSFYQKPATDNKYILKSEKVVEYLNDREMREVIEDMSF